MAVFAAIGILEPVLALPMQAASGIAAQPKPDLVHALVEPLHTGVLAGALAVQAGVFCCGAAGKPERNAGDQHKKHEHGNTHAF